jgi:hypothetical protein
VPDGWGTPSLDGGPQQVTGLGDAADPGSPAEVGTLEVDRARAPKASRRALEEADQAGVRTIADVVQGDADANVRSGRPRWRSDPQAGGDEGQDAAEEGGQGEGGQGDRERRQVEGEEPAQERHQ